MSLFNDNKLLPFSINDNKLVPLTVAEKICTVGLSDNKLVPFARFLY